MNAGRNQGWEHYWKEDRAASCVPESATTAEEIAEYWIGLFTELVGGSRILDIATGNGVVLAHAAAAAERSGGEFSLTGVDLADIDPAHFVSGLPDAVKKARFLGGVDAEKLPMDDDSFDVVASQYGLEYADLHKALAEVERVLAMGGRLIWLAHSDDSSVVAQNRDQGRQVEFLLAPGSPSRVMEVFISKMRKRRGMEAAAAKLQAALSTAEQYCRESPPANIVTEVCTALAQVAQRWQAYDPGDLDHMLADSRKRLIAHRQRINDLLASVLSPEREQIVRGRLVEPAWRDTSIGTLRVGSAASPIGFLIEATRGG